jgi:D-specific alpha-keto acid dehydrogenase
VASPTPARARPRPERSRPGAVGLTVYGCEPDEAIAFRTLAPGLGIVPTIISAPASEARTIALPANRSISVDHRSAVTASTLRDLDRAGVDHLSSRSIGLDHIDLDAATALGITVEGVAYAPDGVADFTLMLILMAIRDAREVVTAVERQEVRRCRARGRDLRELTVGVVGVGRIGTAVVRRLRGFGCQVLAYGNHTRSAAAEHVSLGHLLRTSDVVTLHLPLDASTHHLIGRAELAAMKPGAVLVNTARGGLVDTGALVEALERGALGGVALDVLEGEERLFTTDRTAGPPDHELLRRLQQLPNALVTPHTAYFTERALQDTVEQTLRSCLRFEGTRTDAETHDRDPLRGLLGGARRLGEVGDRGGGPPRR